MQNKKVVIGAIIVLVLIFLIAGNVYKENKSNEVASNVKENYSALVREHSTIIGNKNATKG